MNEDASAAGTPAEAAARVDDWLHRGEPVQAYNAAQSALQQWPDDVRLRQLQALALARSGDVERAAALLSALVDAGHANTETLAMLARTHKDRALSAADPAARGRELTASFRLYQRAFDEARAAGADDAALYAGINAATLAVLRGDLGHARRVAGIVRTLCERAAAGDAEAGAAYWRTATLGEAALILGDTAAATAHYRDAVRRAGARYGDLSSTRRQLRLLSAHLPEAGDFDSAQLRIPPVVSYTGHMIDAPGRHAPRFPPSLEAQVRSAVHERLAALQPVAAYGSAACGADLLCLEVARELGCETHVVLPFPPAEFRGSSVDFARGTWGERFERALAAADSVVVASDHRASGSTATFEYANLILTGMGRLRAEALDTDAVGLAVWDPRAPGDPGGAASVVSLWRERGMRIEEVHPQPVRGAHPAPAEAPPAPPVRHELRSLLFADAVGYSQLAEDQIPGFINGFLAAVAALNRRTRHKFEHVETSGDGLYLVFGNATEAGRYALELAELARGFDRKAWGLPASFNLRIALHCGPVHCAVDPITGGRLYTGPHTSRAARIEPITPPGQVYASSAFAAVAAASGGDGLALRYVGRIPLAKGYGTLGLYNVQAA